MVKEDELSTSTMSLGDHLEELRARLILALLGLVAGTIVCFAFGKYIIRFIENPYIKAVSKKIQRDTETVAEPNNIDFANLFFTNLITSLETDPNAPDIDAEKVEFIHRLWLETIKQRNEKLAGSGDDSMHSLPRSVRLQTLAPAEAFVEYMKVSFISGLVITCPWVFYQIWMFVAVGLYKQERLYVRKAIPFCSALFVTGALFFLFVVAPISLKFFLGFGDLMYVASHWTLGKYISFVTTLMLVFGLAFQTPIAIFILHKVGLVKVEILKKYRKYVFLSMFFIAAVVTPPDVVSQITLGVPLYLLYELGIILCQFAGKKESNDDNA